MFCNLVCSHVIRWRITNNIKVRPPQLLPSSYIFPLNRVEVFFLCVQISQNPAFGDQIFLTTLSNYWDIRFSTKKNWGPILGILIQNLLLASFVKHNLLNVKGEMLKFVAEHNCRRERRESGSFLHAAIFERERNWEKFPTSVRIFEAIFLWFLHFGGMVWLLMKLFLYHWEVLVVVNFLR